MNRRSERRARDVEIHRRLDDMAEWAMREALAAAIARGETRVRVDVQFKWERHA